MSADFVWLASYPKSGNTWVRAIITALGVHEALFDVNGLGSGGQPYSVRSALPVFGLDPRWLEPAELDVARHCLLTREVGETTGQPRVRKTHERYRPGVAGREPFPSKASRAAILVVRDPRDVACSYAPFFGISHEKAVELMATEQGEDAVGRPCAMLTPQPWGSWSSHTRSWLADDVPFPVHVVTFEDLEVDAVKTLLPVFEAVGMGCTREELQKAVERTRFENLRENESARGFRERSPRTKQFFREGRSGGWRDALDPELVAGVEADHAEQMQRLGYALTTPVSTRTQLAQTRRSARRASQYSWLKGPAGIGLSVRHGEVPDELPGAARPRRWLQVTRTEALVRFGGGVALHVADGTDVTVQIPPDDAGDAGWLVQGWAVTIASLQRGDLSLHAGTVRIGDTVLALAGNRGAGKSTTAMALRQAGHELLVDDVTLLDFQTESVRVRPFSRNVHLLPDAAEAMGLDFDALPRLSAGRVKAAFLPEPPDSRPVRLDGIVILDPRDDVADLTLEQVRGRQRLTLLEEHTRRLGMAPLILGPQRYFELTSLAANRTSLWRLTRPREQWTLDEAVQAIEGLAQSLRQTSTSPAAIRTSR